MSRARVEARWFGSPDRPLAAQIHRPAGSTRGVVVVVPPIGYEHVSSYRALRQVAIRLAGSGWTAIRFDLDGSGASAGQADDPDRVRLWQRSVDDAVLLAADLVDGPIGLVGLRLGATLAAGRAARVDAAGPPISFCVLWQPVVSGRRLARELKARARLSAVSAAPADGEQPASELPGPAAADDRTWVYGHPFAPQTFREMAGLDLSSLDLVAVPTLVVVPAPDADDAMPAGSAVARIVIDEPNAVVGIDAELVASPRRTIEAIGRWIDGRPDAPADRRSLPSRPSATLRHDGVALTETFTRTPGGLHALWTRPSDNARADRVVLFLNNGVAPCSGPGRLWTDLARRFALAGVSSLRVDMTGIGDSPGDSFANRPYVSTNAADVRDAVAEAHRAGGPTVDLVGLCSGAILSLAVAGRLDGIGSIVAINPPLYYASDFGVGPIGLRWLWRPLGWTMTKRPLRAAAQKLPPSLWKAIDAVSIYPLPDRFPRQSARRGADVSILMGDDELGLLDLRARARWTPDTVLGTTVRLDVRSGLDHSLFAPSARQAGVAYIEERLAIAAPAAAGPPERSWVVPRASVIIPAHDEGAVIARTLRTLLADAAPGEFEVVVVANGCTDDTAEQARSVSGDVVVVEQGVGSKTAALNDGDRVVVTMPRIYLDADIEMTTTAARAVADALSGPEPRIARPPVRFDLDGASWVVRRYYGARARNRRLTAMVNGSGTFALSAAGRARFDEFPALTGDDLFADLHFTADERSIVATDPVVVRPPRTATSLLHVLRRVRRGNRELAVTSTADDSTRPSPMRTAIELVRTLDGLGAAVDFAVFAAVTVVSRRPGRSSSSVWQRDDSSRQGIAS